MINPNKTYSNETIVDKLHAANPGYTKVLIADGKWQLHPEGYVAPAPKAVKPAPAVVEAPVTTVAAAVKAPKVEAPTAPVGMFFAGAREKDVYVITLPCGENNKERWFKKTDLVGVVATKQNGVDGLMITAQPRVFTSRKIAVA